MPTEVIVALISTVGVIAAAVLPAYLIQRARRENSTDHATVMTMLRRIEQKFAKHLEDHENGHFGRPSAKADKNTNH